jgi:hypothetical protein
MHATDSSTEASPLSLREVPSLPLRAGRHLTAWILWHTAKVNLAADSLVAQHSDEGFGPAEGSV